MLKLYKSTSFTVARDRRHDHDHNLQLQLSSSEQRVFGQPTTRNELELGRRLAKGAGALAHAAALYNIYNYVYSPPGGCAAATRLRHPAADIALPVATSPSTNPPACAGTSAAVHVRDNSCERSS